VNTAPVDQARIVFDDDGTPRSAEYGDVYHPRSGALAQARHVFLGDGALAGRWCGHDRFVVLETGFGVGNNFLATWAAWRADPQRCRQLHFVSIEQSPPTQASLARLARDEALAPLAAELACRWPALTCNLHRIAFDDGAVELLLAFGAVDAWLPQILAEVDAFFLDGFAPARNPAMWDARVFKAMARLAAADATVATWSAARAVRDGLAAAGFAVERAPGSGGKRDITRARFAPRFTPRPSLRRAAPRVRPGAAAADGCADVIVVGAGLAGCALARALAERGARSLVLERNAALAGEASGNAAGVFHGIVHRRDGRHARFYRAAAFAAADAVEAAIASHGVRGSASGLLRVETRLDLAAMRAVAAGQGLPVEYVEALGADDASRIAGVTVSSPAWHYPRGGWVDPRGLAQAWLASAGAAARLRTGCAIAALQRDGGGWSVCDAAGTTIAAAPVVVVCDGGGALIGPDAWPLRRQRGQINALAAIDLPAKALPRLPITGNGYVLPPIDGSVWFGTSSAWDDDDQGLRDADATFNDGRLAALLGLSAPLPSRRAGRVGRRWVSADRLPLVGAVPAEIAARAVGGSRTAPGGRYDQPRFVPRAPGLFVCIGLGSRGIAAASLGSELLAATITSAPVPVEADLLDAVDPARFLSRETRRASAPPPG
jgi:tRNA 5-methylaminomethyl-2-thiouridine biosynthesis bifunctional protein